MILFLSILACTEEKEVPTPPAATPTRVEMDNGTQRLTVDGLEREYILYQPADVQQGAPLVVVMHGYTGTAEGIEEYSGMNDLADEHGFVVAYPQGTIDQNGAAFFNVGYAFHDEETVDDVAFVRTIVSTLQDNLGLSTEHVFTTGMSNGGEMSYLLGCQAADVFSAVGSVAGIMMDDFASDCNPVAPIPVLEIHGTDDDISWYNGDYNDLGGWGAYWGITEVIDFWVQHNALEQQESTALPDIDANDGSSVVFERYWSEQNSVEVWLYRVEGGGHDWPGVWGNGDIHASQVVWEFFHQTMN